MRQRDDLKLKSLPDSLDPFRYEDIRSIESWSCDASFKTTEVMENEAEEMTDASY